MNFRWLPAADSELGFFVVVAFMLLVAGGMLYFFRKRGFL
jgi:LPXTG-motif cell wall-anchored protein